MLTPLDIQEKKFKIGLGYDKKDVNDFVDTIVKDFTALYRSNAELKDEVALLNDNLQLYKSRELELEKNKLLAEKDSEDTKSRATKEAKNIELDAKNKAKVIIGDAEERLLAIKREVTELESRYAEYKSEFSMLLKKQFEFLQETDFDVNSKIDENYLNSKGGSKKSSSDSFGAFGGDPQMRDESTLGNGGSSTGASDSSVYTKGLGGDDFVDPFNPSSNNRFNPFSEEGSSSKASSSTGFKVSSENKTRVKRNPASDIPNISEA